MEKEEHSLAFELITEIKASAKRWFIAFLVMLAVEAATVLAFLWYLSLPVEEYGTEQTIDNINNSDISQRVGNDYGTSDAESNIQEAGGTSQDDGREAQEEVTQ